MKTPKELAEWMARIADGVAAGARRYADDGCEANRTLLELELARMLNVLDKSHYLDYDHVFGVADTLRGFSSGADPTKTAKKPTPRKSLKRK